MQDKPSVRTVVTPGFSMEYLRFGRGDIQLVVLPGLSVKSVMASAAAIAKAYAPMTEDCTLWFPDHRRETPAACTIHDMARDTADALPALGLSKVCLCGFSQGGMMAMDIAVNHPELVSRLILGSTAALITPELAQALNRWKAFAKAGDAEGLYLSFGEQVYPPSVFEASRSLLREMAGTVTPAELKRFAVYASSFQGFDMTRELPRVACPVLALGDRQDRVLGPGGMDSIRDALAGHPDFEWYLYDGFGHAAYDTAPDYRDRLLKFARA